MIHFLCNFYIFYCLGQFYVAACFFTISTLKHLTPLYVVEEKLLNLYPNSTKDLIIDQFAQYHKL